MTRQELLAIAKPILFNTEMVQAILEGRKTVTRRIVKKLSDGVDRIEEGDFGTYEAIFGRYNNGCFAEMYQVITPPFKAGDYLYVRETWGEDKHNFLYKADFSENDLEKIGHLLRWRPSIHMPKTAARLFLKVKDVRVERLQDVTEEQVLAEGIYPSNCRGCTGKMGCDLCPDEGYYEIDAFQYLWDSTIKKADLDKYGWNANPWVWVIEFERVI